MILDDLVFDSATSSSIDDIIEEVMNEGLQRNTND